MGRRAVPGPSATCCRSSTTNAPAATRRSSCSNASATTRAPTPTCSSCSTSASRSGFEGRYRGLPDGRAQLDAITERRAERRAPDGQARDDVAHAVVALAGRAPPAGSARCRCCRCGWSSLSAPRCCWRLALGQRPAGPPRRARCSATCTASSRRCASTARAGAAKPRLAPLLQADVAAGRVEVRDEALRSVVTLPADALFVAGSARIEPRQRPICWRASPHALSRAARAQIVGDRPHRRRSRSRRCSSRRTGTCRARARRRWPAALAQHGVPPRGCAPRAAPTPSRVAPNDTPARARAQPAHRDRACCCRGRTIDAMTRAALHPAALAAPAADGARPCWPRAALLLVRRAAGRHRRGAAAGRASRRAGRDRALVLLGAGARLRGAGARCGAAQPRCCWRGWSRRPCGRAGDARSGAARPALRAALSLLAPPRSAPQARALGCAAAAAPTSTSCPGTSSSARRAPARPPRSSTPGCKFPLAAELGRKARARHRRHAQLRLVVHHRGGADRHRRPLHHAGQRPRRRPRGLARLPRPAAAPPPAAADQRRAARRRASSDLLQRRRRAERRAHARELRARIDELQRELGIALPDLRAGHQDRPAGRLHGVLRRLRQGRARAGLGRDLRCTTGERSADALARVAANWPRSRSACTNA